MNIFSLEGKVALVTGARRGIGKAIALAFAEAGADVAICDLVDDDGQLQSVAEQIESLGRRAFACRTDVALESDVENLVESVESRFGRIDILVNNAGISLGDWDKVMDANLKSAYLCSRAVARGMVERKQGNIINLSSTIGITAGSMAPRAKVRTIDLWACAYPVSKAGMNMLTQRLAQGLAASNVRVNGIAPAYIDTELGAAWGDPDGQKVMSSAIPMGRLGTSEECASVALFLASDAASYVTGDTILVDGGLMA